MASDYTLLGWLMYMGAGALIGIVAGLIAALFGIPFAPFPIAGVILGALYSFVKLNGWFSFLTSWYK